MAPSHTETGQRESSTAPRPEYIIRDSKLPFYHQIYEIMRAKILAGEWKPGTLLPSESNLMAQHNVSRVTVRQSFEVLLRDGLVYRQRGRGTFVAHPQVEQGLTRIISFTEDMRQRGFRPGTRWVTASLVPADEVISASLAVPKGTEMVQLLRVRLADDEPLVIEESFLIHRYCPGILTMDYRSGSLRDFIEKHYGISWSRAKQSIHATLASKEIAALLGIAPKAAVLFIERTSFDQRDIPLEFLRLYHRGDRYALHGELRA